MVNLDGEVIGVNSMTATAGISFAIPSKYVNEFVNISDTQKTVGSKYRYLGMKMITLNAQIYHLFTHEANTDIRIPRELKQGCLIIEVAPNSPAEK